MDSGLKKPVIVLTGRRDDEGEQEPDEASIRPLLTLEPVPLPLEVSQMLSKVGEGTSCECHHFPFTQGVEEVGGEG